MEWIKAKEQTEILSDLTRLEWLETNGLGGWSGSTLANCHTRRYHGLLMAATVPPADRFLLVSKLDETIVYGGIRYELGCNRYGDIISPDGIQYLKSFKKGLFPTWTYDIAGIRMLKSIAMVYGENTTLIKYEVLEAGGLFEMELLTLIAARDYNSLQHASSEIFRDVDFQNGIFHNQPFAGAPDIYIAVPGSSFQSVNKWYFNFNYVVEKYRGQDFTEDLFNHGILKVSLQAGDTLYVMASTENPAGRNPILLFEKELQRKQGLLTGATDILLQKLTLAADQFIVKREITVAGEIPVSLKTVIAGYHWFTDWGRDTMISLPGLCLCTGRLADAKMILSVFAKSVSEGMLPNRFQDFGQPPEYNNVDATLWYFNAIHAYLLASGDRNFILHEILPVLKNIIEWHYKGTRFNIHVDADGLLYAGEIGQQLTWMDARIGDLVVTPRMGKPVEIQALWYNALRIFESLLLLNGEAGAAGKIHNGAEHARASFFQKFWYAPGNYLYDVIDENGNPDPTLRPNQLFALSLPFHLLDGDRATAVLDIVRAKLLTPVGLRSLSPDDPKYCGHYGGDGFQRDSAYHQGTVWSWLLGVYIEALLKTNSSRYKAEALAIVTQFVFHLDENCIGSVSEIFDGDAPHAPRGCVAQAWGVAEILRVVKTYSLFHASS